MVVKFLPLLMFVSFGVSHWLLIKIKKNTFVLPGIFFGGILIGYLLSKLFVVSMLKDIVFVITFILTCVFMLFYSIKKYKKYRQT